MQVSPTSGLDRTVIQEHNYTGTYNTYIIPVTRGKNGLACMNIKKFHKITVIDFNTGKVVPVRTIS
jgi:hypothetical protein